jgi:regulator of sigma E protease
MAGAGYFIILLGVLIAVHEFGHFLFAKWLGVKVLRFSIGFGPKLIGFTRGETEYQVALLPLGGYVKMAGEQPHEELSPEEAKRGFLAQPPWKRALIVGAGPAFNLIFPVLAYFAFYLGDHQALSTRVGRVEEGLPAAAAGIRPGDRITAVDGEPVKTFDQLRDALKDRFSKAIPLELERDGKRLTLDVTPFRGLETDPVETTSRGFIGIQPVARLPILGVKAGSPAEAAGLRSFDRVTSVNGKTVDSEESLLAALASAGERVELQVARFEQPEPTPKDTPAALAFKDVPLGPGTGLERLGVERADLYVFGVAADGAAAKAGLVRGDRLLAINGKPIPSFQWFGLALQELKDKPFELTWQRGAEQRSTTVAQLKVPVKDELGNKLPVLQLGLTNGDRVPATLPPLDLVSLHMGPGEALAASLKIVPEFTRKTVLVVAMLFTGDVPLQTVGGPVMMYQMAARSAEEGWGYFLQLLAAISINLGVMNLLPIPILDGFHLVSAGWEAVRRRPIPERAREVANMVGLAMLVLLMIVVFKNDITRVMERDKAAQQQR